MDSQEAADDLARLRLLDRLTVNEAALYLRCSRRSVYRLIAERRITVTKVRSSTFIRRTELDRYLAANRAA